jgi:hypothetical protein
MIALISIEPDGLGRALINPAVSTKMTGIRLFNSQADTLAVSSGGSRSR